MFAQTLLLFYSEYTWPKLRPGIADGCFLQSPPPPAVGTCTLQMAMTPSFQILYNSLLNIFRHFAAI